MRKVKFLQDHENWKKDDIVRIPRELARKLITDGIVTYYVK